MAVFNNDKTLENFTFLVFWRPHEAVEAIWSLGEKVLEFNLESISVKNFRSKISSDFVAALEAEQGRRGRKATSYRYLQF